MENILKNIPEILILLFLIITFLQSGLDKIFDWNGNLTFLKSHFSKTFMKNTVPGMLVVVTLLEIVAGVLSIVGVVELITSNTSTMALYGVIISCLVLLMLLFGQRIAKDYAGALTITCYFVIAIFGVYLLHNN